MASARRLLVLLAVGSVLAAAAALVGAVRDPAPAPLAVRAEALSRELRCPVCGGETVADSQSDVAAAMRAEISDQLSSGRSDAQVREWFAQRYGADVVLRPATDGAGAVVWLVPALVVGAGVVLTARVVGRPGRRRWAPAACALVAAAALAAPALLQGGADQRAPAPDASAEVRRGQALAADGRHGEAVAAYRSALEAGAAAEALHLPLALALVRSGRPAEAVPLLRDVVAARPDDPEALLVLAAALRDSSPDEARAVLRQFLAVAPDHAGAAGVRQALGEQAP